MLLLFRKEERDWTGTTTACLSHISSAYINDSTFHRTASSLRSLFPLFTLSGHLNQPTIASHVSFELSADSTTEHDQVCWCELLVMHMVLGEKNYFAFRCMYNKSLMFANAWLGYLCNTVAI